MRFDVTFRELDKKLDVDFRTGNEQIKVDFEHFQIVSDHSGVEYYKGDYTVTPKTEKQELATRQKFLTENGPIYQIAKSAMDDSYVDDIDYHGENVLVKIPFFEVSNTEGGQTVFIGKEL